MVVNGRGGLNFMMNKKIIIGLNCFFTKDLLPGNIDVILNLCEKMSNICSVKYYFKISGENKQTKKKNYSLSCIQTDLESAYKEKQAYLMLDGPYNEKSNEESKILEASIILFNYWKINKPLSFECTVIIPNIKEPIELFYKWAASVLKYQYGLIFIEENYNYMLSELEAIPRSMWQDTSIETKTWEEELGFYYKKDYKYNEYVRKAYWGNFLNSNHICKLGGFEKVKNEAPAYLIETMPEGGAYIQLTEKPFNYFESNFKKKLKELDRYFSPIILPGRPVVVWNYYDKKRV